jgi:hypothetical protein
LGVGLPLPALNAFDCSAGDSTSTASFSAVAVSSAELRRKNLTSPG